MAALAAIGRAKRIKALENRGKIFTSDTFPDDFSQSMRRMETIKHRADTDAKLWLTCV
ncbi:hypothetical protein [Tabrizicola sp.]|uniref:hypothetical protein n=1 Tax=Tabrizicola sp. TaxID=2005166 RepID=UPI0025DB3761|nr:hypothetical protein [Tabrizicola sp.]